MMKKENLMDRTGKITPDSNRGSFGIGYDRTAAAEHLKFNALRGGSFFHLFIELPCIFMNSVFNGDDLRLRYIGVFGGVAYGEEAGQLVIFRRADQFLDTGAFVADGDAEGAGQPFCCSG